ncbi:hypothetical protein CR162_21355 [Pseudoroseomonas rhizosphaerae]|uniref:Uncharacterized protein n=1 Tax=Teichococcus rhizosphaerae TaxID=1335062 RepID=A0A2C7A3K3_9PROT|nr:hypothetical protein [Pseudoroseomonas rhizosphaerae]PHK92920.1 hypothetical protein CR162_21355 [Pseudoroseomonas rhizosphaerae]
MAENPQVMTPTQQVVAASKKNATHTITTPDGQVVVFRELGYVDTMKLNRALAYNSYNRVYAEQVELVFMIQSVGGIPFPRPSTFEEAENLAYKAGDDVMWSLEVWREEQRSKSRKQVYEAIWGPELEPLFGEPAENKDDQPAS